MGTANNLLDFLGMIGIRRAFFLASATRYFTMAMNIAMVPIIARLMGPAEFGISVLGMAALAMAEAVRDFGGTAYIIQAKEITRQRVNTVFTIMTILTVIMAFGLFFLAGPVATFFEIAGLEAFLKVTALCYLVGPFVSPLNALLRRDLEFGKLAVITMGSTTVYSLTAVILAVLQFSFMSFAWASLASAITAMLLGFAVRRDFRIFRFSIEGWRSLVSFGRYEASASMLITLREYLPFLIFGRALSAEAVGLYQRALTICELPQRTLLGGLGLLALPAMSASTRNGAQMKDTYLIGVKYVTAVHWPSLVVVALLAHPIVVVLLGPNWIEVAALAHIMAVALLLGFGSQLTYSALIAAGAVHRVLTLYLLIVPFTALVLSLASQSGLQAVAWSMFIIVPVEAAISLYLIRSSAPFSWGELADALRPSAVTTAFTMAGPLTVLMATGFNLQMPVATGFVAGALSGVGWLVGLRLTGHPLFNELVKVRDAFISRLQAVFAKVTG